MSTYNYGERTTDQIVDSYFNRIKDAHENQNDEEVRVNVAEVTKANGGRIPSRIKDLLKSIR